MEVDSLFGGLPAHPLLVHGAVVLVPLAAIAFVATGWRENWRRTYLLPIALLAAAGGIFAFLAKESGESLSESIRRTGGRVGEHPEQGDTAFLCAMLLAVVVVGMYILQNYGGMIGQRLGIRAPKLPVSGEVAMYAAVVPVAILALVTMVIAGHSGAQLVWKTNAR